MFFSRTRAHSFPISIPGQQHLNTVSRPKAPADWTSPCGHGCRDTLQGRVHPGCPWLFVAPTTGVCNHLTPRHLLPGGPLHSPPWAPPSKRSPTFNCIFPLEFPAALGSVPRRLLYILLFVLCVWETHICSRDVLFCKEENGARKRRWLLSE